MAVKVKPQTFVASDGAEFSTEEEAKAHDELTTAVQAFQDARKRLGVAMACKTKTADGYLFDPTSWRDYWRIINFGPTPMLARINFGYDTEFGLHGYENGCVELIVVERDGRNNEIRRASYSIDNLYATEEGAKKALHKRLVEHIAEQQEIADKLKKDIGIQ
jgi:hypothetical protein